MLMKKITFMLIALLVAVVTFAAGPKKQFEALPFAPAKASVQMGKQFNAKQAPAALAKKMQKAAKAKVRSPKKAAAVADFVGDYQWDYATSNNTSTDLESLTTTAGSSHVVISESATTEGGITISGMFTNDLEATIVNADDYDYFQIEGGQLAGTSSYGDYLLYGLFYYAGDEEYSEGWYYDDIYGYLEEDGTITIEPWLVRVLTGGDYDGYSLTPYFVVGSTLTPAEPLTVVELPDGVEAKEYVMTYDDGSTPVKVAVDGNDVYFQGMSHYIPEAWVKGTKDGNAVTFAAMQYMGEYDTYGASYFFYNGETVFTYDAEADTYTAEGQVYGVLADRYYDGNYTNPVIAPVVEKAVMPADPAITALTNGDYGWYFTFNVPLTDVNGDPLVASKLSYMIYTDTEGEIAPLTFTPDTHTYLTEDMTEIPYGFTEDWDFYNTQIFLNDLYSADWNKIGIQSIYRGGGEENATEIQWFDIKEYAVTTATFNFNEMEVPTSSNVSTDGDITEDKAITEGKVTLTISAKEEGKTTANRFWSTSAGPQLRVYSGTLTFSVPDGYSITEIKFNHNSKWGANTINGVAIENDTENNVATWTLAEDAEPATEIVVAIAANSQINSIDVTVAKVPDQLVELPEGVEAEAWALEGFYSNGESGMDILQSTEVAIVGNDIYVKGLAYYFEDAWLKGTIEDGIATFPAGQFVGEDKYGKEYMNGYDEVDEDAEEYDICDIQYYYDAEAKTLTQATLYVLECGTKSGYDEDGELSVWGWWEVSNLHAGDPIEKVAVEVPEDLVTEDYLFSANEYVEVEDDEDAESARRMKTPRKALTLEPYEFQIQVGFDGQDVYFKGFTENTADMWAKGTLSEDGKTVTIPANQYIGTIESFFGSFDYHLAAIDEYYEPADIVLNYDAEAGKFSTEQTVATNGSMFVMYTYQSFGDVEITKIPEVAATPADPSIDDYKLTGTSYPYVCFNIPAEDVDGNAILASKLFYTVWVEVDGSAQPYVVLADEYSYIEEDITEVPYTYDDNYDIYRGGSRFYFNPADAVPTWKKIGVQSIYYGGGECNKSKVVWMENPAYDPTVGITNINADNQKVVIFDLQGRRVAAPAKGLYIVNGKKVVIK